MIFVCFEFLSCYFYIMEDNGRKVPGNSIFITYLNVSSDKILKKLTVYSLFSPSNIDLPCRKSFGRIFSFSSCFAILNNIFLNAFLSLFYLIGKQVTNSYSEALFVSFSNRKWIILKVNI